MVETRNSRVKVKVSSNSQSLNVLRTDSRSETPALTEPSVRAEVDYSKMTANEVLKLIIERNKDPIISHMLVALSEKIPREFADYLESEKRARSIVIAGIAESSANISPSERQSELETKVSGVLDVLQVECRASEIFRIGKPNPSRPRLVKVVLPSTVHWRKALANARLLRNAVGRRGGGVCCIFKNSLLMRMRPHVVAPKADVLCVDTLFLSSLSPVRFIIVYRPPRSCTSDDDSLLDLLATLSSTNCNTIVLGDLNLNIDWVNSTAANPISGRFMRFFGNLGLSQLSIVPLPDFLHVDYVGLNRSLSEVDWLQVFDNYDSATDVYCRFCGVLYKKLAIFVPFKIRQPYYCRYPRHIQNLLDQKLRVFKNSLNPLENTHYKR
ncbi:hypothetical protein COOONC_18009, partial [Cooperia oncophora]